MTDIITLNKDEIVISQQTKITNNKSFIIDDGSAFAILSNPGNNYVLTSDPDGYVTWQPPFVETIKISLTSSELKNLLATPIELIPGQSNHLIVVSDITTLYRYGGTAYTTYNSYLDYAYHVNIGNTYDSNRVLNTIFGLELTQDCLTSINALGSANGFFDSPKNFGIGESLYLVSGGTNLAASSGNGTLDIWISFKILDLS